MDAALRAIAEPRRREILRLVRRRELPAGAIAAHFAVTRPAISQHLRVLREAGLVDERRDGTRRLYRARPDTVEELRRFLDDFWTDRLERLRDAAEAKQRDKEGALMAELVHEIVVDASPGTIYELLTVADEHVRWMGTEAKLDPRPGGTYRVLVAGAYPAAGEFVEVVPHQKVVFTFGWDAPANPVPPGSSTIEISLHPEGSKTRVRLVHRDLPEEVVGEHTHGWAHYLGRLSAAASGTEAGPDAGPGGGAGG